MSINSISPVRSDINEMLNKIKEMSGKSQAFQTTKPIEIEHTSNNQSNFKNTLSSVKDLLQTVNESQVESDQIKTAYLSGDKNVTLSQVLVASQKSKLAFEGLVTVRNKILDAYKEIMNMPV